MARAFVAACTSAGVEVRRRESAPEVRPIVDERPVLSAQKHRRCCPCPQRRLKRAVRWISDEGHTFDLARSEIVTAVDLARPHIPAEGGSSDSFRVAASCHVKIEALTPQPGPFHTLTANYARAKCGAQAEDAGSSPAMSAIASSLWEPSGPVTLFPYLNSS